MTDGYKYRYFDPDTGRRLRPWEIPPYGDPRPPAVQPEILPPERGARPKPVEVPYRPDPRSTRPRPLPWGPGNPSKVIDQTPKPVGLARKFARGINKYNQYARALDAAELLYDLASGIKPGVLNTEVYGMTKCDGPYPPTWSLTNAGYWIALGDYDCNGYQQQNQAYGNGVWLQKAEMESPGVKTFPEGVNTPNSLVIGYGYEGIGRWNEHSSWVKTDNRTSALTIVQSPEAFGPAVNVHPNPNVMRWADPDPQPVDLAVPDSPAWKTSNYWADAVGLENLTKTDLANALKTPIAYAFSTVEATGSAPGMPPPPTVVRVPTTPRQPPEKYTRERKFISKSKALGIVLFKVLDKVSEAADVVDAVYEALPEKVRKRWPCKKRPGPVDNFGQYGIGGADCKAAAIYYNLHSVDVEQAVRNIIANQLEDAIYGGIHKHLPKQAGGDAMDESWKAFAKMLEESGLFDPLVRKGIE